MFKERKEKKIYIMHFVNIANMKPVSLLSVSYIYFVKVISDLLLNLEG